MDQEKLKITLNNIFIDYSKNISELDDYLEYLDVCHDICFYLMKHVNKTENHDGIFHLLQSMDINDLTECLYKKVNNSNKRQSIAYYGKIWNKFLLKDLEENLLKQCVVYLGEEGLSKLSNGALLADALIKIFETNQEFGVASAAAVFDIMLRNSVEYDDVYDFLYIYLDENVFYYEESLEFFQHLDMFLTSESLSPEIARKFALKLDSLIINAPYAYMIAVKKLIINICKRYVTIKDILKDNHNGNCLLMSRLLMNVPKGIEIDNINCELDYMQDNRSFKEIYEDINLKLQLKSTKADQNLEEICKNSKRLKFNLDVL